MLGVHKENELVYDLAVLRFGNRNLNRAWTLKPTSGLEVEVEYLFLVKQFLELLRVSVCLSGNLLKRLALEGGRCRTLGGETEVCLC